MKLSSLNSSRNGSGNCWKQDKRNLLQHIISISPLNFLALHVMHVLDIKPIVLLIRNVAGSYRPASGTLVLASVMTAEGATISEAITTLAAAFVLFRLVSVDIVLVFFLYFCISMC